MTVSLRALGPVKHTCTGCGGSCMGVRARLVSVDERDRIVRLAAELGVPDPIDPSTITGAGGAGGLGALRQIEGRCVFLQDDQRCRIHATYGSESKPHVCRQYPLVAVDTGSERRIGIDPGCYTAFRTHQTGDEVRGDNLGVVRVTLEPAAESQEYALLALLKAAPNLRAALGNVAAPGIEARWLARLKASDLPGLIARPETGPAARTALAPLAAWLPTGEVPGSDPKGAGSAEPKATGSADQGGAGLSAASDAWTRDVARRMVFLRLQPSLPPVAVVSLVLLGGLTLSWVDPAEDRVAAGLAAWCRALRAPLFVRSLVPDGGALRALLTGSGPNP